MLDDNNLNSAEQQEVRQREIAVRLIGGEVVEPKIPKACKGVKCMIEGCSMLAEHKIGEENIFFPEDPEEEVHYVAQNMRHNLTTYLCHDHFKGIMTRDTNVTMEDDRFPND